MDKKDFSATDPKVNFTFAHKMSLLSFTFQSSEPVFDKNDPSIKVSDGVDVGDMISYEIEGLGVKGSFDTKTGICALDDSERKGLKMTYAKTESAKERPFPSIIVFPQTKPEDKNFVLHITTDELTEEGSPDQKYNCVLRFTDDEIKPGCHYKFTVKVTKYGLIVGDLTIVPWDETDRFIVATIDGEPNFKNQ